MSQEQLAGRAQVAVATVRKIEKGVVIEPGYFTVLALMHALGATSEDAALLGRHVSIVANFLGSLLRSIEEILVTGH